MRAGGSIQTYLIAIWPSYGWPSTLKRAGLEIFSVITAVGRKTLDRMTVMAVLYGRWEKCSVIRGMRD
jgi:hypothetical protein